MKENLTPSCAEGQTICARKRPLIEPILLALAQLMACGDPPLAPGDPGALPDFDLDACTIPSPPSVTPEALVTGPVNNVVVVDRDVAWIVHSGDNTVGRLDLITGRFEKSFVDVDDNRNPWDLAPAAGRLLITNFIAGSISIADAATGQLLAERDDLGLDTPTGVAAAEGFALVASAHFVGPGYGPGTLTALRLLDGPPFVEPIGQIQTSALSPLDVVYDEAHARFVAISSGDSGADPATGLFSPRSDGALDLIALADLGDGLTEDDRTSIALPLSPADPRAGNPRTLVIAPGGRFGYLPSGTSPQLYKVDLDTLEVLRGPANPIAAYIGEGNQLTGLALRGDGVGYVTAFNQDALYLFDTGCDASVLGPIDLGNAALLEGPIDIAHDPARGQALAILSVSSALTIIKDR